MTAVAGARAGRELQRREWTDAGSLLVAAVAWGSSYAVVKVGVGYVPVLVLVFLRFGFASAAMLPFLRRARPMSSLRVGLPLGAILFVIFVLETAGVARTSAANAAFLISLCVPLTPLLEAVVYRRRATRKIIAASLLSCCGAAVLGFHASLDLQLNSGDALMLGAALLRAVNVIATRELAEKQNLDAAAVTASQLLAVTGLAGIALVVVGQGVSVPASAEPWAVILYLALACTLLAFYLQTRAVKRMSPTRVNLIMGTEPLFGAIFAVALIGEHLTAATIVGGLMMLVAAYAGIRDAPAAATATPSRPL